MKEMKKQITNSVEKILYLDINPTSTRASELDAIVRNKNTMNPKTAGFDL